MAGGPETGCDGVATGCAMDVMVQRSRLLSAARDRSKIYARAAKSSSRKTVSRMLEPPKNLKQRVPYQTPKSTK